MNVKIEKQKDGTYIAYNTDGNAASIIGTGNTISEAKDDFFCSIQETVDACREAGVEIPRILSDEPVFKFDVSSLFEYYGVFNMSAFAHYIGMNETLMRQYKKGNTYISDTQLKR